MNRLLVFIMTVCFCFSNLIRAHAQQNTITGTVKNGTSGDALAGVNVLVKGTQSGTQTDDKGEFSIRVKNENTTLVFSYVGYKNQEIKVGSQDVININLEPEVTTLDQVVVVGYGTQKSKDLTAPVVTIKSEEITKQPVSNALNALQGKVAGVMISTDGKPGGAPTMLIRGVGSVRGAVSPLYIVDEVFMDDVSSVSPSDIESVTILKDASSCAIYGVRAANGVVIITTKKGAKNRPAKVSYNGYVGVQSITNKMPLVGSKEYVQLINEKMYSAFLRDTSKGTYSPFDPANYPTSTNWYDELLRNGLMQSHDLSVTGGSEKSAYYFGVGLFTQEGLVKKNDYTRFSLRGSHDITINKYVKTGYSLTLSAWQENAPADVLTRMHIIPPVFAPKNAQGNFTNPLESGFGIFANPSAVIEYNNSFNRNLRGLMNLYLEVKPIRNLTLKTSFTPDLKTTNSSIYVPKYWVSSAQYDTVAHLTKESNYNLNYVWDNTATYEARIDDHRIKAMAGFSAVHNSGELLRAVGTGVPDFTDATHYIDLGDKTGYSVVNNPYDKISALSYFGRVQYSFKDRYLATATLRRDGSSKFPSNSRWGTFPSVGLGWIISDESFMKKVKGLDFLKARASWGKLGNDKIPQNAYTLTANTDARYSAIFGPYGSNVVSPGANITTAVQPKLKWEIVEESDAGFEAAFLRSRLNITADYYHRLTKNAIFDVTLIGSSGASGTVLDNNADILNQGFEFTASWADNISNKFSYRIGANLTTINNTVKKLKDGTLPINDGDVVNGNLATYTQQGHPIGEFWVYQVDGIFQNFNDVHSYKNDKGVEYMPNAVPGDFKYKDVNGDGVIDRKDRVTVGSYIPKITYGFNIGINYNSFDLSADFQGVAGNKIYNKKRANRFGNESYDADFYNHSWHGEGTSNTYPNADISGGLNAYPNTFFVESGSYFRVRNIQLGYTMPSELTKKIGIERLRFFVTSQNPFTYFKYNGVSPEITGGTATTMGIDNGVYPLSRTTTFGVNVNF